MASRNEFLAYVKSQIGKPYVWGADSPQIGFDCSGLVVWAAKEAGAPLPLRTTYQMAAQLPITSTPGPGDLVLLNGNGHVGVCVDEGCKTMIDAPHTGAKVRQEAVWSNVSSYRTIPSLTGTGASLVTGGNILAGEQVAAGGGVGSGLAEMVGSLPGLFVESIFGDDMTLGQLAIRFVEITGGIVVMTAGIVLFALSFSSGTSGKKMAVRRAVKSVPGSSSLPADADEILYRQIARQVRDVDHAQAIEDQDALRARAVQRNDEFINREGE